MRSSAGYLMLFGCIVPITSAQGTDRILQINETTYARIASPNGNAVGNSGFILLEDSVVVFDTHYTPEAGRELLKEIRSITDNPVRYVVNSHFHPDHTHGNQVFEDALFIGNWKTRRNMLQDDLPSLNRSIRVTDTQLERMRKEASRQSIPDRRASIQREIKVREDYLDTLKHLKISAPLMVMDEYLSIKEGAKEMIIRFLGSGHTDGDVILILPAEKIVFCGDLFFNTAIPNVQDASLLPWMQTLAELLELDANIFIPGHGPPGDRQDVRSFLEYFEDLQALVEPFVIRGFGA